MVALNEQLQEASTATSINSNFNFISESIRDENHIAMNLQQHHFGGNGNIPSPTVHNVASLGRKVNNRNGGPRSYQRLSTFRPLQGQHADLVRECIEDRLGSTTPTYETIDPHHLSHLGYSADYGTASGSGCSSGSSLGHSGSGCIETILPDARCYGTVGRPQLYHGGSHQNEYQAVHTSNHLDNVYKPSEKKLEQDDEFTFVSALFTLISLLSYLVDVFTDVALCYFLYWQPNQWWFGLTVAFTIVPSITVNAFSIRWYMHDSHTSKSIPSMKMPKVGAFGWLLKAFAHLLFFGPVLRYIDLLRFGLKSRCISRQRNDKRPQSEWHLSTLQQPSSMSTLQRSNGNNIPSVAVAAQQENRDASHCIDYKLLSVHEDRDTALLSLLKSFMESAPMAVLQVYILAVTSSGHTQHTQTTITECVQTASILSSLFEISWSLASYHRALRRSVPEKRNMSKLATIVQFLWRFLVIASRVVAIALFTSEFGYWLLPVAVGHWGVMTIWVMHQGTRFCDTDRGDPRPCEEYLFNMVVGAIYLICFLNVKDEPTRFKYLAYYVIVFAENSILITFWYWKTSSDPVKSLLWFHAPAFATVISAFSMGIVFMLIYYRFLHPNGRPLWINRAARCC